VTRLVRAGPAGLAPYADGLARLERAIRYPVADGANFFRIDHGPDYAAFFAGLGRPEFLLALDGRDVVGTLAGVYREARWAGRCLPALYACDYKLAASKRGAGLGRAMLARGLRELATDSQLRSFRLVYGAAMRGAKGDVMRSARGLHPARLARPIARLHVYFAEPRALAALEPAGCPPGPLAPGLDLSPNQPPSLRPPGLLSTRGRKDLRLGEGGEPWPLEHLPLGPSAWTLSWGAYLRTCGEALVHEGAPGPACFALDERLTGLAAWLRGQGVEPGAGCTVYGLAMLLKPPPLAWAHLATSEI
jgi:hypothetical protein